MTSMQVKQLPEVVANRKPYIGSYHEAAPFLKSNEFIVTGYRINYSRPKQIVLSLFSLHNETVNVWTHLFTAFCLLAIAAKLSEVESAIHSHSASPLECQMGLELETCLRLSATAQQQMLPVWPLSVFLFSSAICLFCSATFHLVSPMSQSIFKMSHRLDYVGISLVLTAAPFPAFYYSFHCNPTTAHIYLTIISCLGILCYCISLSDWIHLQKHIVLKMALYCSIGMVEIVAIFHLLARELYFENYGDNYRFLPSLFYYVPAMSVSFVGLCIYAARCPQRQYPGRFDLCGQSHQIWHCCVVAGIILVHFGALNNYNMRDNFSCSAI